MKKSNIQKALEANKKPFKVSRNAFQNFVLGKSLEQVQRRWKKWNVEEISIDEYLENTVLEEE